MVHYAGQLEWDNQWSYIQTFASKYNTVFTQVLNSLAPNIPLNRDISLDKFSLAS